MKVSKQIIRCIIDAMKSIPCEDCLKSYPPCVMDFDHLHSKKINIAEAAIRWNSVPRLLAEIDKCEVVCSNCHRVRTHLRRIRKMETERKKMTRDEITAMLKSRVRSDGQPFRKHEGPRKRKTVSPEGLKVALSALQDSGSKVAMLRAFGTDGRTALKALVEGDASLASLLQEAFPGTGQGRPFQDSIKTTADGKAVISGFDGACRVRVTRNEDGTVVLAPIAAGSEESKALDAAEAAIAG